MKVCGPTRRGFGLAEGEIDIGSLDCGGKSGKTIDLALRAWTQGSGCAGGGVVGMTGLG